MQARIDHGEGRRLDLQDRFGKAKEYDRTADAGLQPSFSNEQFQQANAIEGEEQEAMLEEAENLSDIHSTLNTFIAENRAAVQRIEESYRDYHPVDSEGRAIRNADMRERERKRKRIEQYEGYLDSPYYGHIDVLDEKDEPHKVLIGTDPVEVRGDQLVVDWRSDMADVYYNKHNLKPVVKGKPYTLMLRRTVTIENTVLQKVVTEYDATSGEAPSEVVDEFLLSVLRDKRRQYKLTDIIKTIQQNQNEILRFPANKSFIVQGCAGSGKTMILLHRLSYLAFNEPGVDFSRYVIVTPSDSFNDYLDSLNLKLELEHITKYSVESYYTHLIKRLSFADTYTTQTGVRQNNAFKITIPSSIELYEGHLGVDLLKRIYSNSFLEDISTLVNETKQDVLNRMISAGVAATLEEQGMSTPGPIDAPYTTYSILASNERRIRESLSPVQRELEEATRNCSMAEQALEGELNRVTRAKSLFEPVCESLASTCLKHIGEIESAIEQTRLPIERNTCSEWFMPNPRTRTSVQLGFAWGIGTLDSRASAAGMTSSTTRALIDPPTIYATAEIMRSAARHEQLTRKRGICNVSRCSAITGTSCQHCGSSP